MNLLRIDTTKQSATAIVLLIGLAMAVLTGCQCRTCASSHDRAVTPVDTPAPSRDYTVTIPDSTVQFDMVWIEGGGFWMSRTEVTWDAYLQYCAFDGTAPEGYDAVSRPSKPLETSPADRGWGEGARPAVGMSRNAAAGYCGWLSMKTGQTYQLPTEAQWRLACGELPTQDITSFAWCAANSNEQTQEVGQLSPNKYGLHDMLGNLWEYCTDPYDETDPERAVLRGGSWRESPGDINPDARLGFNDDWVLDDPSFPPGVWWVPDGDHLGFRIVRMNDELTQP